MTEVRYITPIGVEDHADSELAQLLDRTDGFVWVDIPRSPPSCSAANDGCDRRGSTCSN